MSPVVLFAPSPLALAPPIPLKVELRLTHSQEVLHLVNLAVPALQHYLLCWLVLYAGESLGSLS